MSGRWAVVRALITLAALVVVTWTSEAQVTDEAAVVAAKPSPSSTPSPAQAPTVPEAVRLERILLVSLISGAGVFLLFFVIEASVREKPSIETHWGGFGGGLGGIRVSASLLYLVVALLLCGLAAALVDRSLKRTTLAGVSASPGPAATAPPK